MDFQNCDTDDVYELNVDVYKELEFVADNCADIRQCMTIIKDIIFQTMKLSGAKETLNEYFIRFIKPFLAQVFHTIFLLGWCPYKLEKNKQYQVNIPVFVPPEYLCSKLRVNRAKMTSKFEFFDYNDNKKISGIRVLLYTDITKLANPYLIDSIVFHLLPDFKYYDTLRKYNLQAEFVRTNPAIYLKEDTKDNNSQTEVLRKTDMGRTRTIQKNTNTIAESLEQASESLVDNIAFHQRQMELRFNGIRNSLGHSSGNNFNTPLHHNNLFVPPPRLTYGANPLQPTTTIQATNYYEFMTTNIFKMFSIPPSLYGASRRTISGARTGPTEAEFIALNSTIDQYGTFINHCFRTIYYDVFSVELPHNILPITIDLPFPKQQQKDDNI